ncbi:acetoin dehydrogenase dihydrolipoyllysine-residue acetyltransferase subunit [Rhizobium lusitanum]|uniref:Acetoin dehydrogenase dihydrolipoyllysine-residue acetyltransferase subunit n=1 Tax=Rhizobium lusitanum TaxID=293958 RepID=A0A6L9UEH0_9HYPH|nr:acetoin dehydrogenase dihydrolipoyllysine-residue acetyltransferase subunit [Rhizobium lusitanum]NEI74044.1 acetoin dehydrogenase dihydrolipoyllysine-residue acetyltransferase subunit [Rhizobium lusitanum]
MTEITAITMPKWGLTMEEGTVAKWAVNPGDTVSKDQEIVDIETTKIANAYESPVNGILRRVVVQEGEVVPVGALIAVVAPQEISDAEIDGFIAEYQQDVVQTTASPVAQSITLAGGLVSYLKVGPDEGEPVVLVHGFGADHKGWLLNQAALAERHPTYALDLPGHGASYKQADDFTAQGLAGVLRAFLVEMNLTEVHLVGHSLGAAVAAIAASDAGDIVKTLTLISPAGLGSEINGSFFDGFIGETRAKKLRPYVEMLVAEPSLVTTEMVEDILKSKRLDGAQAALTAVREANFPGSEQKVSIGAAIADINIPIQIILGAEDKVIPGEKTKEQRGVKIVEIAGAGHIPHLEKSCDVNQRIQMFIGD